MNDNYNSMYIMVFIMKQWRWIIRLYQKFDYTRNSIIPEIRIHQKFDYTRNSNTTEYGYKVGGSDDAYSQQILLEIKRGQGTNNTWWIFWSLEQTHFKFIPMNVNSRIRSRWSNPRDYTNTCSISRGTRIRHSSSK